MQAVISVGDRTTYEVHIAPLATEKTKKNSINEYYAVLGPKPTTVQEWQAGKKFTHTYGDGSLVAIEKAIQAIRGTEV